MKVLINSILALCAVGLLYLCYGSIMGPIEFENERDLREKDVIASLINIRDAQVNYRNITMNGYCDNFDSLIQFGKTA